MGYKLLDTNILLLSANNLLTIGKDSTVILPSTVLEELDGKKELMNELGFQARSVGRMLTRSTIVKTVEDELATNTLLDVDGVDVIIVALKKFEVEVGTPGYNDQKIIECAQYVSKANDVEFMTNDIMARFRGLAVGLKVGELKVVEDTEHEFVKEMSISDDEVFRTLHNTAIADVDSEYQLENYSYMFTSDTTGQVKLATIVNGFVSVVGKDSERELKKQSCAPIGARQLLTSKAILDQTIDLVVIEGRSGSGKNIVALSSAMKLLSTNRDKYTSIVYIRNPVDDVSMDDEKIGFLSGNDEKEAVYLGPMEDTVEFMARNKVKKTKSESIPEYELRIFKEVEKIKTDYGMEARITLGLRGKTYSNAIIIMDEWQNAGAATTVKVLTRVGKDCKVIVTGSQNQIDSAYLNKHNNGLAILMSEAAEGTIDSDVNMFAIQLDKVQRSAMCDFADKLFSK